MKVQKAEFLKRVRIHAFSMLILLIMMAECDSITSPDASDQSNNAGIQNPYFSGSGDDLNTAGSLSSTSGSYTITLLPDGAVNRQNAYLVVMTMVASMVRSGMRPGRSGLQNGPQMRAAT